MPIFVLLQRAEDYGAGGMLWSGEQGARAQRQAIRQLGGRVRAQYAVMGRYDVVLVVELPDDETALAIGLNSGEGGFYTEVLRAFSPAELKSAAEKLRRSRDTSQGVKKAGRSRPRASRK